MSAPVRPNQLAVRSSPWLADFSVVRPGPRRAARYALHMVARYPKLHERFDVDDFLGALWALALPLVAPAALAQLEAHWKWHDPGGEEENDPIAGWGRRRGQRPPLLTGVAGARMRDDLKQLFAALPDNLLARLGGDDGSTPTHPAVAVLVASAGLDATEAAILDLAEKAITVPHFDVFLRETCTNTQNDNYACLSAALGIPASVLDPVLRCSGTLRALRLLKRAGRSCNLDLFVKPGDLLLDLMVAEMISEADLLAAIVEPAPPMEVTLDAFPHLARDTARVLETLQGAAAAREVGVNALFYGPPGAGKTQLALALAVHAGFTAYRVRSADDAGDCLSREGRLGAYLLTQRLLRGRSDCIVIFDEVEDAFGNVAGTVLALLRGESSAGQDKGWMSRLLEENPVPAIWITNDAQSMDPAFLRRFLLPVAFATPPRSVRRQIATHHLGDRGLPEHLLDDLAADEALLPAQFGAARRLLDLRSGGDPEAVVRDGVEATRRLLHGSPGPRRREPVMAFDVAYLNLAGSLAPARLMEALARRGRGSLCFLGPPGTGKTEFAHILAEALDRELVVRRVSDLVSKWVGETEKNIAQLFAEADAERSILFLDEVDSFLRDRQLAQHSLEVTAVNELLQQMESFPGVFIAATNLAENLDGASLRRFDLKLQFRPLTVGQRRALLARETLGDATLANELHANVARRLDTLETLTPGDYANVVRQQNLLGEVLSPEEFLKRLMAECRLKDNLRIGHQAA